MPQQDIIGQSLKEYHYNQDVTPLIVHNNYGNPEEMSMASLYRNRTQIPDYEWVMVALAFGKTLDLGGGCGSHALLLQEKELEVVNVEISPGACEVAEKRGVIHVINEDFKNARLNNFETITMVMNGVGLVGTIEGLIYALNEFKKILSKKGQLIFDSTNISYLNRKNTTGRYFGEVRFKFEYKKQKGDWFNWLYIDTQTLSDICKRCNWKMQIVFQDDDHYVARLVPT